MPVSAIWYDDSHRVLMEKLEGNLSWEELHKALVEWKALAESVPHNVVLFVDISAIGTVPKGNLIAQGRSGAQLMPGNVHQVIIVIQSRLIEVFAGLVFDMMPKWRNRVKFAKTFEEGQRLLADVLAAK